MSANRTLDEADMRNLALWEKHLECEQLRGQLREAKQAIRRLRVALDGSRRTAETWKVRALQGRAAGRATAKARWERP